MNVELVQNRPQGITKIIGWFWKGAALLLLVAINWALVPAQAAPPNQNFDSVPAGTSSSTGDSLTLSGLTYSSDAVGDVVTVDTISNITGGFTSLGTGNGLAGAYNGADASATYFQFASVDNANNFKIVSYNAEVFGHVSQNCEVYTIKGYDNGVEKVTATVNFHTSSTYGTGNSTINYTRLTTAGEENAGGGPHGANCGTLAFSGSDWGNIDQVRMIVADAAPNTFMTVSIDNLVFADADTPNATPTDLVLSGSLVNEWAGMNAVVGLISTTDSDSGDTHTYTLVSGTGDANNALFTIETNALKVGASVLAAGNYSVRIQTDDGNGGTYAEAFAITSVDDVAPTISDANISISGATGTGGAYKIGDTVTATWNNTAGGDNNSDTIASVTVNFSQFGGGAAVAASNSSGTWTATYTITSSAIDASNRNISATATDNAGNATTRADTTNATVDNVAPTVSDANISISGASGIGGAYKIGDTVTATWNNTAGGDNNSDTISNVTVDFSQFGGGAAVSASNSAGTWTATYTITSGAIDASNRNVSVTATDNAGNTTARADSTNASVDNGSPVITSAGSADGTNGIAFSYNIVATGGATVFGAGVLPTGLSVNSETGEISGQPTQAGTFNIEITASDAAGNMDTKTLTLTLAKAQAVVSLANLSHTFDGTAKSATATTTPTDLTVLLTYEGLTDAPTNVGSYEVIGTITEANYTGSVTNTLVIAQAEATVTLAGLNQVFDGEAKAATASTEPTDLTVMLTYNGSTEAPTNAGSYEVIGAINEANYSGITTNTLVIAQAQATVTLAGLSHVFDGSGKSATATTAPAGLAVLLTYYGLPDAPTNAGSYEVIGTVSDVNYTGSATNTLIITLPAPVITLSSATNYYTLRDGPTPLDASIGFSAPGGRPFAGGSLSVTIVSNLSPVDLLWFHDQESGTNRIVAGETEVSFDGTPIATYSGGTTGLASLQFTFTAQATQTSIQELLRTVAFSLGKQDEPELLRVIEFNLTDGDGATSEPVSLNLVFNNQPQLRADRAVTGTNLPVQINYTRVLINDTDPDGDSFGIVAVSPESLFGGTVVTNAMGCFYTPAADFEGVDEFSYTVMDARGGVATRTVTVIVLTEGKLAIEDTDRELAATNQSATVVFMGIPDRTYQMQATENLIDWVTLGTVIPPETGLVKFYDQDATNHVHRFYRTFYP